MNDLKLYLGNLKGFQTQLYFSVCAGHSYTNALVQTIKNEFEGSLVIKTTNVGKDIGGKLAMVHLFLMAQDTSDLILFMHDKKSPHTTSGANWRSDLLSIAAEEKLATVEHIFSCQEQVGIVASKKFILNEYNQQNKSFTTTNDFLLKKLRETYGLKNTTFEFVGGTMFWIRSKIVREFFLKHSPLKIRESLEVGNVLDHEKGTYTHSWERLLSWIALDQGYKIVGI
ncbi:hypothetical protein GU926_00215 [Nibribacter ruber]|uniref:Glycosyltransferase n=1 Tax=Nibribacter ruber TaxID=2698458 RepID=A0A6P1NUK9_9BACT|nr:hypothetical protein GU926_00215 [Nibribacter ruber]